MSVVVAQFGRVGPWGKQVFRLTVPAFWAESLARGRVISTRRNEHTSGAEPKFRGMETAKFGQDGENIMLTCLITLITFTLTMKSQASKIGSELVRHSRTAKFSAQRGAMEMLFPYIYQASKRMSTRAISDWLLKEYQVEVSAVTISKSLNDPGKYWNRFYEYVATSACRFAFAHGRRVEEVLFNPGLFHRLLKKPPTFYVSDSTSGAVAMMDYQISTQVLLRDWFELDEATIADLKIILGPVITADRKRWEKEQAREGRKG